MLSTKNQEGGLCDGLTAVFSLTPLAPLALTYDPANSNAPWALAFFETYGGITNVFPFLGGTLTHQYNRDEIALGDDPVKLTDQAIHGLTDLTRHCSIWVYFIGEKVSKDNQYLLLFFLRKIYGSAWVQIFTGLELVRKEKLNGEEQIAILLDSPGAGIPITVGVRLATDKNPAHVAMGFKGMRCYLL